MTSRNLQLPFSLYPFHLHLSKRFFQSLSYVNATSRWRSRGRQEVRVCFDGLAHLSPLSPGLFFECVSILFSASASMMELENNP